MNTTPVHLLLAEDDIDDCNFFKDALEELDINAELATVNDGVQLMDFLAGREEPLPDALYLDLNMPRKNGLECLTEIKQNEKLKTLPVIIFSTSYSEEAARVLYE